MDSASSHNQKGGSAFKNLTEATSKKFRRIERPLNSWMQEVTSEMR